ncbi:MAG: hypothetical protein WCK09_16960 [Bacteroidota bacterium]
MKHPPPLEYDRYYHIYNRGNNGENLFIEPSNYEHFLRLYSEYITPVAETFAWVLIKNHLTINTIAREVCSNHRSGGYR